MNTGLPAGDWLPVTAESARGLRSLGQMKRVGIVKSTRWRNPKVQTATVWQAIWPLVRFRLANLRV